MKIRDSQMGICEIMWWKAHISQDMKIEEICLVKTEWLFRKTFNRMCPYAQLFSKTILVNLIRAISFSDSSRNAYIHMKQMKSVWYE